MTEAQFITRVLRIAPNDTGCRIWPGTDSQRAHVVFNGKRQLVHRVSYEIFHHDSPDGWKVLHTCDVPRCVEPSHLFLGTQADNINDMHAKQRHPWDQPGHPLQVRGEKHGRHKLTQQQVNQIRSATGPHATIAHAFSISRSQVTKIKLQLRW